MGSDAHEPEEAPTHRVTVANEQFRSFVDATDYVTVAERQLDAADGGGCPISYSGREARCRWGEYLARAQSPPARGR